MNSMFTNMNSMFGTDDESDFIASAFNQDIVGWDTSSVTNMDRMFRYATAFNQYIGGWNISSISDMDYMLTQASAFNQNLCAWKDKFPYQGEKAYLIFANSGCTYQTTPTSDQSSFCAGSADECQAYTHSPTANPSKAPSPGPSHSPTPTPAIDSWDLELESVDSNFDNGSENEITLTYKIGAGRKFEFIVLKKGCIEEIDGVNIIPTNSTSSNENDPSLENLHVFLDVKKDTIVGSNTWNPDNNIFEFCLSIWLLSRSSGEVIKKLEHDFGVELLFDTAFETANEAQCGQITLTLGSNQTDAQVENYVEACTCDSMLSFECNQNVLVLGPDDFLNICIKSVAEEMEIDCLDSLKMVQEDKTLDIVSDKTLVDGSISSKSKVALKNGVHVASVIPASFFSYDKSSTAQVSGVVFLKLAESRRRRSLALEIDSTSTANHARVLQSAAGDQESAFAMEVQLEKNELGVTANSNAAFYAVMTGVISSATAAAIVTAAAVLMFW